MPAPAASIIIATYNRSAALRRALAGVLAQTYTDFEVLVVGDACTDDSEAVVRAAADDRVYWLNRAENSGSQALPHNDGLARSRGRYIAYCDHDDIWFPWHLGGLVARLEETGADFVQDYLAWLDGDAVRGVTGPPPDGNYAAYSVTPSVWLVRRALLEAIGDWPEPGGLDDSHVKVVLRRFAQAGASFAAVSRLGALVFPSHLAPVYATPGAAQQDLWAGRVATPACRRAARRRGRRCARRCAGAGGPPCEG
ncbi:MAG: glycosyltransferase family 2 protein [Armatimonadetes bacterium]|nr:glycosyltransferase family 2 protein [Armatimonadota bacterium]